MSEDPGELQRFYDETIAPLSAYDDQYETDLVTTIEAYLENDGNVTPTADQLFTHRHTVRYRLERVKELCGHDITSTEGREKLGLGLKAMRVLGIAPPRGPALEPGTEAGRAKVRAQERGVGEAEVASGTRIGEWPNWQGVRLLVPGYPGSSPGSPVDFYPAWMRTCVRAGGNRESRARYVELTEAVVADSRSAGAGGRWDCAIG